MFRRTKSDEVMTRYHLKDVIVGKIYFLLVRIKIKHMELSIIRRETTGSPPNQYNESETITKFEIMDGAPVRGTLSSSFAARSYDVQWIYFPGETIPIRLFLGGFDLTPTFRDVNKKFSTRYYLNLVLIDEENRRYFKQQVRMLWAFHLFQVIEMRRTRKLLFLGYPRYANVQLLSSVGITLIYSLFSSRPELNYPCTLFYLLMAILVVRFLLTLDRENVAGVEDIQPPQPVIGA
jgi:Vacuolar protein sorting-associated protein 26